MTSVLELVSLSLSTLFSLTDTFGKPVKRIFQSVYFVMGIV